MALELPEVTQRFIADTTEFVAAVDAATAAVKELADACMAAQAEADALTLSLDRAGAAAADATRGVVKLRAAIASLKDKDIHIGVDVGGVGAAAAGAGAGDAAAEAARLATVWRTEADAGRVVAAVTRDTAVAADVSGAAANRAWRPWFLFGNTWETALHWIVAGSAEILAVTIPALIALGAGMFVALQGAVNLTSHMAATWKAFEAAGPAVGKTMGDFLGLGHAMQAAQDAANPGVYELLGSVINDARTRFADFAKTGLDVVHMLDEFSARITVDLQGKLGAQMHAFLDGMTRDLQQIGQVFGNFGHALLNVFSDMPGLVHILLSSLEALSRFALVLSGAPAALVMFAMGLEEVFRWGGLALGVLTRLVGARGLFLAFAEGGGFVTRFGAALKALVAGSGVAVMGLGQLIGKMGLFGSAATRAGAAVEGFGSEMAMAGATMSTAAIAWATLGIAAFAGLALALMHVKDAAGQMASNAVKAVQAAGDLQVMGVATHQLLQLNSAAMKTNVALAKMPATAVGVSAAFGSSAMQANSFTAGLAGLGRISASSATSVSAVGAGLQAASGSMQGATGIVLRLWGAFSGASSATDDMAKFNAAETAIVGTVHTVGSNINFLAGAFHTSAVGALALANAAGVNLQQGLLKGTEAGRIAVQMIDNLRRGLGAMQAPAGVVGADMEALGIQSQLAGTKVLQVNQAFDQFVGTLTGGMTGLAQFEGALHGMAHDALSSSVGINGAIRSISRSATSMGFTLRGMGPKAQQSWQQFSSATQQAQSVIDTLRIGMAEGVVSFGQFKQGVQAAAGQLLPFAAKSATARGIVSALAQQAGFPATHSLKTLATQLGITGNKAKNVLAKDVEQAITKMSSMSTVARNLSGVVSGQLDQAMAASIVKFSGVQSAANKYAQALSNAKTPMATLKKDHDNLVGALQREQKMQQAVTKAANEGTKATQSEAAKTGEAAKATGHHVKSVQQQVTAVHASLAGLQQHIVHMDRDGSAATGAAGKTSGLTSKTSGLASAARTSASAQNQHATSIQRVGNQARTSASAMSGLHTAIGGASSAAAGATGRMYQLSVSIGRVGTSAFQAAAAVRQLGSAISALQSKTITVTTNMVTTNTHRQHGGPVLAGMPYTVGEAGPEMFVPSQSGVILPADMTASVLSAQTSVNAAGGGGHVGTAEIHVHAHLDGKEVFSSVQTHALKYQTRNAGARTGLLIPGNQVGRA